MSEKRLRAECLPSDAECSYVRATVDGCLAGHAFACRWKYDEKIVCWISQLVVHRDYRERGLAMCLLNELKQNDDDIYGIASSHAAACLAAANAFGSEYVTKKLSSVVDFTNCRGD
jgi:GNAT superfamily N-acetyltransferase